MTDYNLREIALDVDRMRSSLSQPSDPVDQAYVETHFMRAILTPTVCDDPFFMRDVPRRWGNGNGLGLFHPNRGDGDGDNPWESDGNGSGRNEPTGNGHLPRTLDWTVERSITTGHLNRDALRSLNLYLRDGGVR